MLFDILCVLFILLLQAMNIHCAASSMNYIPLEHVSMGICISALTII